MAEEMPDYTDPNDLRRLRKVGSDQGWIADRDDPDLSRLRVLYERMDELTTSWGEGDESWDEGNFCAHLAEITVVWTEIRTLHREA